jgi:hypothetical protein
MSDGLAFRVIAELLQSRDELRKKLQRRHRLIWQLVERNKALKAETADLRRKLSEVEGKRALLAAAQGDGWIAARGNVPLQNTPMTLKVSHGNMLTFYHPVARFELYCELADEHQVMRPLPAPGTQAGDGG